MDVENRAPFDALVGPLFHFCCEQIKTAASCSNFPEKINITECINTIMVIYANQSLILFLISGKTMAKRSNRFRRRSAPASS